MYNFELVDELRDVISRIEELKNYFDDEGWAFDPTIPVTEMWTEWKLPDHMKDDWDELCSLLELEEQLKEKLNA